MAAPRSEIPIVVISEASPTSPIAGATAFVKDRATSSLVSVFSDSGTTNNTITQPLTTDSGGRLTGWLPRGAYVVEITISGKTPYSENLDIAPGSNLGVDTSWIAENAVTAPKLASEAVETAKVKGAAITEPKLASEAVTTAKLGNSAVTEGKIANLAVNTGKIAELCVTTAKLAAGAVTEEKLVDGLVSSRKMKPTMGIIRSSADVVLSGSYQNLTGAVLEITPSVASKLWIITSFQIQVAGNGAFVSGTISIDGTPEEVHGSGMGFGGTSVTQSLGGLTAFYEVPLTAAKHTIRLIAKGALGGGFTEITAHKDSAFFYMLTAS